MLLLAFPWFLQVAGAPVLTGAEWEPVLLTVVRPYLGDDGNDGGGGRVEEKEGDAAPGEAPGVGMENGGPGLIKETRGFACGATLGEVREALGQTLQQRPGGVLVSVLVSACLCV